MPRRDLTPMRNDNLNSSKRRLHAMAFCNHPARVRNRRTPHPTALSTIDCIMMAANADPRLHIARDVIQILSKTGLRATELRTLRMLDLDIATNRLFIRAGKGETRYIPLTLS
jgi:integrase